MSSVYPYIVKWFSCYITFTDSVKNVISVLKK